MDSPKLVKLFAERFNIDPNRLLDTLKATAFKQRDGSTPDHEHMMALLVVANQYGLNPFTREIYAFPDKQAGIVPVVGVDGWARIINQHEQFDGIAFNAAPNPIQLPEAKPCPEWMECILYRKDRQHPIRVSEYLDEVYRPPFEGHGKGGAYKITGPWQSHTKRMLRHKAMIQCARLAFGLVGIFDHDEAERIIEGEARQLQPRQADSLPDHQISQRTRRLADKLIGRARASGAWHSALDYARTQFPPEEQDYVTRLLQVAQTHATEQGLIHAPDQTRSELRTNPDTDSEFTIPEPSTCPDQAGEGSPMS